MKSRRRIKDLSIQGYGTRLREETIHLNEIVEHFGRDVRKLELKSLTLPNITITNLLNQMPELEKIVFTKVSIELAVDVNRYRPQLLKLKEIDVVDCYQSTIKFLAVFPDGLKKVKIVGSFHTGERIGSFNAFESQHNIEDIVLDGTYTHLINFNQFKLKYLELGPMLVPDLGKVLKGQDEIKVLKLPATRGDRLKIIGKELKSLENLEITEIFRSREKTVTELSELSKLKKLVKLKFSFGDSSYDEAMGLMYMKSNSLEHLDVDCEGMYLTRSIVEKLGVNLPKLTQLHISSQSPLNLLNSIIQHMPNLEVLGFKQNIGLSEPFFYQRNLTNDKIKVLNITVREEYFEELEKLFTSLKSLESVTIVGYDDFSLKALIQASKMCIKNLIVSPPNNTFESISYLISFPK